MKKKMVYNSILLAVLGLLVSSGYYKLAAQQTAEETVERETEIERTQAAKTTAAAEAAKWGVTAKDWTKYERIMKGPRGMWSPGLDPITALGVAAETQAERRWYAELFVRTEFAKVERELAFQREVAAAWKRLYPETPRVRDFASTRARAQRAQRDPATIEIERYALVVRIACPECDAIMATRFSQMIADAKNGVDLYVVGTDSDAQVAGWLKRHPKVVAAIEAGVARLKSSAEFEKLKKFPAIRKDRGELWRRLL
ncbi:probable exported protein STY4558 [Olavius algarvensis associated proteobacterium Delta 3]|nr:probable exported protein STY4558 [Olavius algarvensis associated proteobacterium Delta 3]